MDPNIDQIAPQYADPEAVDTPRTNNRKVAYFYDHDVGNFNYGLGHVMKPHRMRMTHNLLINYGLLQHMDVFRPTRATHEQLTRFHTDEYIDFLERVTPETVEELTASGSRFIVGEDCPAFEGLYEFCTISAGGSIGGAHRLNSGAAETCINWAGGLHHAKKREASGFCYVNDIVLAILELLRYHPRVLYIDIDVHHGDGVEEAFYSTDRVMTCSFHQFGDFFPGTGDVRDIGLARGKNYAVNIPLRGGITDEAYQSIFEPVIQHIMEWYRPGAVILQCGADSLAGDKLGGFNLSMKGHANCVKFLSTFGVPLMLVGGGGYTTKNVARTWTYETGVILGKELDENLPFNDYLEYYGPRYKLEVLDNNMENQNSREYLDNIKSRVIDTLRNMPFAPSSGMHEVPRMSVGKAIGIVGEDDGDSGDESDIDGQINQRLRQIHEANREMERAGEYESDADSSRIDMDEDDFDRAGSSARNRTNNVSGSSRRAHDLSRTSSSTSSSAHNGSSNHHQDHHHVNNNNSGGNSYPYQQGLSNHQSHQHPSSHSYTHSYSANLPSSHSIYPPSSTSLSNRQSGGKSLYYLPSSKGDRAAMGLPTYDLSGAGVGSYNGIGSGGHLGGAGAGIGHPLGSIPSGGSTSNGAGPSVGTGYPGHQRKRSFFSTSGILPGATGYMGLNGGSHSTGGEGGGGSVGGSSDQTSGKTSGVPAGGWGY